MIVVVCEKKKKQLKKSWKFDILIKIECKKDNMIWSVLKNEYEKFLK